MRDAETTPRPLDALWQAPAITWVLLSGECLAAVLALAPGTAGSRLVYFGLASLLIQWVALLSLGMLYLLRHALGGWRPQKLAWLALGLLLLNTWLISALAWAFLGDDWPANEGGWPVLVLRLTGIALAVGFLGLAAFQNHWRGRLHAVRAKQSELQALQARIRPHFLFNTLNTGAALVHQRPEEAERLLLDLADLFRAALAGPRQIPLEDELSLARRYLEIEALRFGDRLQVRWELPRSVPAVTVPALSIQPLVENAIRHGAERMTRGDVDVAVTTTPETVVVRISNPLPQAGGQAATGHRVGLNASQVRIEALTGGRGSVRTEVVDGRFVATVRLPVAPG
ncbi:histidine kinase [Lysobacter arseniciresistens ZS79]|uniref:Histidine kinase n=1 Tax=Lysobacter arseniciresistens ZS79 TaxID=913325 RepID=A0A0A0F524_9GAMM|nr:histidine kinase [Lysobacter arseniciresistens]KGM57620.1 histidine kinase [Lysobacter arseniciresistens ZS79]